MIEFPHSAPKGYSYEQVSFKSQVVAIWIIHHHKFSYSGNRTVRSIWGFYNQKTKQYHSPINSKTPGKVIEIEKTTPYTAMSVQSQGVEKYFV